MDLENRLNETEQLVKKLEYQLAMEHRHSRKLEYALAPLRMDVSTIGGVMKELDSVLKSWDPKQRKEMLHTLNFNPYQFESEPVKLLALGYDMFTHLGCIEKFNIPPKVLKSFLIVLRASYRNVPFHNFFHAFNVAHSQYFILTECECGKDLGALENFVVLVSAFCHDIDHPGLNNSFQVNAGTSLAILYNDMSVLEQHHCHQAFTILQKPDCNILVNLSVDDKKLFRKYMTACILSTDLAEHGNWLKKLKEIQDKVDFQSFDHKKILLCSLIKCADISNEIRPSEIGQAWAERVMTEFFLQSAIEKEKGLPFAPTMDPEKTNTASGQIGFIKFLCLPLFETLEKVFPKLHLCLDQMRTNLQRWHDIQEGKQQ